MLVSLSLEHPHEHYTNLDVLEGTVSLKVPNPTNLSSIIVKLEGESRTRLLAPVHPNRPDKQRPVIEVHKFLYKTQVVWPSNVRPEELTQGSKAAFTINAGSYEYPFQFKLPLNTQCRQPNNPVSTVSFSNAIPEFAKTATQHIKATLPPSLTGFPGEAEIRYFVKVTVNRPQFFKENPRATANFTFLPIEPPRPEKHDGEAYARRQHEFLENAPSVAAGKRMSFFDRKSSTSRPSTPGSVPPRVSIDARLPNPAILTSNHDIPLRLLLKNVSPRSKEIYLQMLQVELIGYTKVRAHEATRTETESWIICSFSNMAVPVGSPSDPIDTEVPISAHYWQGQPIPNTVSPTFTTCNLQRFYELEIRIGVGYGSSKHGEDQLIVLPLRLPVKVYSGIAPPKALLEGGISTPAANPPTLSVPPEKAQAPQQPTTPTHASFGNADAVPGQPVHPQSAPEYEDAPPSYEEVVGQELPPINGYRGSYQPPPVPEGAPRFSDEKRR